MRLRWLCCALALASWAAVGVEGAAAGELGRSYRVKTGMVACEQRADFERFVPLAASQDIEAFDRLRGIMIGGGRCRDLAIGDAVFLDRLDSGRACVRAPGRVACLWTIASILAD